ncbi:hypothetical protein B0H10DRAFT_1660708, partial [Mycena sp. CBHHK59/15]
ATAVRGGATLLHMNLAVAAEWLRIPKRMSEFLADMGGTSIFKQRSFSVVVEFMPVSFDPSADGALKVLEDDNGLGRGAILHAHFIKQAARHRTGQHMVH